MVNLISMRLLKAGSGQTLNVKGAYLEGWGDMLGSVGVIAAAVIIKVTGWTLADPVVAVLLGLWVLSRAWVLLQGVPEGVDTEAIRQAIHSVNGPIDVHEFHVWALASTEPVLTAHVVADQAVTTADTLRAQLTDLLHEKFDIERVTLQIEATACACCGVSKII
ncbi:cation diffusion facilitator family transporter [Ottowia thiooxydans]